MTEDLDFEAENPMTSNLKIEVEYSALNVKKEFIGEVKKATTVEDGIKERNCDTEDDIRERNCDTEEINCDTEEISCDIGVDSDTGLEYDTGEVESNKGNVKSDTRKAESDTGRVENDKERNESVSDTCESDTGEIHSDTGEIPNDDLEEGELDEGIPVPLSLQTKTSEVVCRFFQRGTCLYGSHCRNPHFSPMVYNMFEPVLSNKSNFKHFELQNVYRPPIFQPNHMPIEPYIESSWEIGIKKAKNVMRNINLKKQSEVTEDLDIENDWERCLAEAKANIQKSSFKRKAVDIENPYFTSKYSKREKSRERSPVKREYDIEESSKQKYSKNFYSKYEKESNYKRPKPLDVKPILDHLKFVDPWRRSRSPKNRTRSMSFSISPSPPPRCSRNRSVSSSSSSCFKNIYGSSHKVKTTRKKSRSHSASPHLKKGKTFKPHTYNKKRSYSRSFSKSPRKRLYSGSSSSECSGNCCVRKKPYSGGKLKTLPSKVVENKNDKRDAPSERPKNTFLSSATKSSFKKTCRRASSTSHSDSSSAESYLSETSVSSLSDINDLKPTYSEKKHVIMRESREKEKEGKPFMKKEPHVKEKEGKYFIRKEPQERKNEETFKPIRKNQGNQLISRGFGRLSEDFDDDLKQNKPISDTSKLQKPSQASTKSTKSHSDKISGSQSATSHQASKPNMAKKLTDQKPSAAAMELLMYHSFGHADNKTETNSSSVEIKSSQAKNASLQHETTKSHTKYDAYFKVPMTKELASKNTPDVQFKSQPMKPNTTATNIKKEPVSKPNTSATNVKKEAVSKPNTNATNVKKEAVSKPNTSATNVKKEAVSKPNTSATNVKKEVVSKPNTSATNVKKEAVSKRNMLLQQLQAIEDAIARKKQPV